MLLLTRLVGQSLLFNNTMRLMLVSFDAHAAVFRIYDYPKIPVKITIQTDIATEVSPGIYITPMATGARSPMQLRIGITAPKSVQVLRDNAKKREAAVPTAPYLKETTGGRHV